MYEASAVPKKLKEYTPEKRHLRYGVIVAAVLPRSTVQTPP